MIVPNKATVGIKNQKDLWAIENGSDNIRWRDVDIHNDNPAEELNSISLHEPDKIPIERKFYGYPSCFSTWNSSSVPRNASQPAFDLPTGAQFSILPVGTQPDDAWCQTPKNNKPPRLVFQAHSAPLDFAFYDNSKCSPKENNIGLPSKWDGDAFSSFHGSFNSEPPTVLFVFRGQVMPLVHLPNRLRDMNRFSTHQTKPNALPSAFVPSL
ncbi:hypothetical protein BN14_11641 [Rhizoctonia solani AG-1 IB]|uniref:Pyrroloquinoline quinone-dependent pyranose dehydrogenase beta-propeller domain-containing protein n=1 Tax=Thanatephorus cucumeris (strain AG1-IB / isolate 7/3/14) TaxID=1108050 RepID=M5CE79_THACB|nr:hypothetical protein BN14_11641 [Rhizoctonia solani AG-1 IB]